MGILHAQAEDGRWFESRVLIVVGCIDQWFLMPMPAAPLHAEVMPASASNVRSETASAKRPMHLTDLLNLHESGTPAAD